MIAQNDCYSFALTRLTFFIPTTKRRCIYASSSFIIEINQHYCSFENATRGAKDDKKTWRAIYQRENNARK